MLGASRLNQSEIDFQVPIYQKTFDIENVLDPPINIIIGNGEENGKSKFQWIFISASLLLFIKCECESRPSNLDEFISLSIYTAYVVVGVQRKGMPFIVKLHANTAWGFHFALISFASND